VTDSDDNPVQGVTVTAKQDRFSIYLPLVVCSSDQRMASQSTSALEPLAPAEGAIPGSQREAMLEDGPGWSGPDQDAAAMIREASTTYTATTDANGDYALSGLPAGSYTLVPS